MNNLTKNLDMFDVATVLFQATYKVVVQVCQVFNGEYTGQVVASESPLLNKGDMLTFGQRTIL